ncbi:mitotic spindle checkpoint protein (Mad2B) [Histoplasma capsulatum var. duboisii H88]|uniref:Mitotic spindle checkpoint protein (Mad2B) n=1 Tax=Ajellomyces capsulatus (strain H88) TaxID=544711 RepID=A0A8A1LHB9_AJEC8|nr:mitotic spindle checkpoint protein (Mad2B) [Histoplasma capsulatum var. duboisii H88]
MYWDLLSRCNCTWYLGCTQRDFFGPVYFCLSLATFLFFSSSTAFSSSFISLFFSVFPFFFPPPVAIAVGSSHRRCCNRRGC